MALLCLALGLPVSCGGGGDSKKDAAPVDAQKGDGQGGKDGGEAGDGLGGDAGGDGAGDAGDGAGGDTAGDGTGGDGTGGDGTGGDGAGGDGTGGDGTGGDGTGGDAMDAAPEPMPILQLTAIIPSAVSRRVTTEVKLTGELFASPATVKLTFCEATGVEYTFAATVDGPTAARFTIPALPTREQGLYTVTFTNPDMAKASLSCALRVLDSAPPTVTDVVPPNAWIGDSTDGINSDQDVVVTGTGFQPTPRVFFRSISDPTRSHDAISVSWVSATTLSAVVPSETVKMPIGDYHVFVENPNLLGAQWLLPGGTPMPGVFRVTGNPPPRIDSIDPVRCPQASPDPPCPTVTAIGDHFAVGARFILLVAPGATSCPAGTLVAPGECEIASTRTDAAHISASTAGFGVGLYPVKVQNPDDQFDVFYSFLVTSSAEGHLNTGDFGTVGTPMKEGRWRHASDYEFDDFGNAYIYSAGGQKDAAGAPLDSVEFTNVGLTGDPGPWQTSVQYKPLRDPGNVRGVNVLETARTGLTMVHVGAYLYAIGGAATNTNGTATVDALRSVERARVLGYETMPRRHLPKAAGTVGLPKGTWYYRVSSVSAEGESLPSLAMQILGAEGKISVCWDPPPLGGSYSYNVYRSLASDGRAQSERLLATEVSGTCFEDDGFGPNLPAPGRLSGTDVAGGSLAVGSYSYRVSATVGGTETLAGYPVSVAVTMAGTQSVKLTWDPMFGATYNLYRVPAAGGATGTEVLLASGIATAGYTDDGSKTPGTAKPKDGIAPLPPGSLTKWTTLPKQMVEKREGADAIVIKTTDAASKPHTFIFVAGGRHDNQVDQAYAPGLGADNNHSKTIERTEVAPDGSLGDFAVEAQKFNDPRAFFPLLTNQFSDETPTPPPPKTPPCEDLDADGFVSCACFKPKMSCTAGSTTADCVPDCNDADPTVHPGAAEVCGDGKDQDCDATMCDYAAGTCTMCGGTDIACPDGGVPDGPAGDGPPADAPLDGPAADGPPADGPPADAPPADGPPADAPPCTPHDDDGDGYFACDCFVPTGSCSPTDPSPLCAADCCDKPADLGCAAAVTTLAQAATINPGMPEVNCSGVDNNCGVEDSFGNTIGYACVGTASCVIKIGTGGVRPWTPWPASPASSSGNALPLGGPRPSAAGAPIWLLACQGDPMYQASGNDGIPEFEACQIDEADGHLAECVAGGDPLWALQSQDWRDNHAHDALLYFGYIFDFMGEMTETRGSFGSPASAAAARFAVVPMPAAPTGFVGKFESSSTKFVAPRAYYSLVRLNSFVYLLGGTDGSKAVATMERHVQ